jgi:hypothetical protein
VSTRARARVGQSGAQILLRMPLVVGLRRRGHSGKDAMTLADLAPDDRPDVPIHLRPGRVFWIRKVPHYRQDGPVALAPGERPFSGGAHHSAYSVLVEREDRLEAVTVALRGGAKP